MTLTADELIALNQGLKSPMGEIPIEKKYLECFEHNINPLKLYVGMRLSRSPKNAIEKDIRRRYKIYPYTCDEFAEMMGLTRAYVISLANENPKQCREYYPSFKTMLRMNSVIPNLGLAVAIYYLTYRVIDKRPLRDS